MRAVNLLSFRLPRFVKITEAGHSVKLEGSFCIIFFSKEIHSPPYHLGNDGERTHPH